MLAIVLRRSAPGELEVADVAPPVPGPRDVLIRVVVASICGSDLAVHRWDDDWTRRTVVPGQIIGHEFAGVVEEVGREVLALAPGDTVTAEGHFPCWSCDRCLRGSAHICRHLRLLGFDRPGAFAELVVVPDRNVIRFSGYPLALGSLLDPLGNAMHSVCSTQVNEASVLVSGCGPIGLLSIVVARRHGARVIVGTDPSPYRRELAMKLGADAVVAPADARELLDSPGLGIEAFDAVIEASGTGLGLVQSLEMLDDGGTAVVVGLPKHDVTLDVATLIVAKNVTVIGVIGRRLFDTWFRVLGLARQEEPTLRRVVTHLGTFHQVAAGMELMIAGRCGKVVLCPSEELVEKIRPTLECERL